MPQFTMLRAILDNEVQSSDDATKVVKLPLANNLHTLYVKVKCTNGATSAANQSIADVVDKIEVIANGSDVLASLTPAEIRRWALWNTGTGAPQVRDETGGAVQEAVYPIQFGVWPYDANYFLPCARLSDLEARIKYSPTIAATSFATGTTTISVIGLYTMSPAQGGYQGTLCHKTVRAFTSAASGEEQTLLPRGNMLRQLMVYAYEAGIEDGVDISRVKFDLDNDVVVPINLLWKDLQDVNTFEGWVEHVEAFRAFAANAATVNTQVSRIRSVSVSEHFAGDATADTLSTRRVTAVAGDALTIEGMTGDFTTGASDLVADATARAFDVVARGEGLSHAVVLRFDYFGETALLNTPNYDQVRVTLTQGGAGADVRISTQEVRVIGA